ncbi:pyruvate oxidase [Lacticaseibacillus nasuensis]|uniref:Pyruvate oxidase n=1 Tax=Lacticaseibacillus nasuensis JCM 17158 TaxID=1291734 RepID=A0A0R1JYY1_9LACO|nr:pyruvate oxidase [Lacticaseibacillus nasuensis]KRK73945.1 pyruvate oxidase [Lacticaseibacillus nasuensis JCM 17158]MCX2456378.1 pyruvate oxidase [Lacticaseibacillus nasuensis]
MAQTISGSEAMLKVIESWGVDHIYGYPGGSFDSTMNALYNRKDTIKFIQVRHEEAGALAASADAKYSGKIGVCFGSAGPGAVHLMNGLYDAKIDRVPVLAIVAQVPSKNMNIDFFQAQNEEPIFDDVAVWNRTVMTAQSLPKVIDEAIQEAYEKKGVAVVTVPKDFGWAQIKDNYVSNANTQIKPYAIKPDPVRIDEAVRLIAAAKGPMIYFGQGAKHARKQLIKVSEKLKMPMVSSVLAKGILDEDYPAYLGSTGRVAPKPGVEAAMAADLILWVGNDVPFASMLFNPKAKVIQIDIESTKLGKRRHNDVAILADAKEALKAIYKASETREPTPFYTACIENKKNWVKWQDSFKDSDELPVRPEPIFDVLNKEASDQAVFAVDVGNVNINFERLIDIKHTQKWSTSGKYATMGWGVPAAISAKTLYPDRDVYALCGDGAFAMLCEEILTQVKYKLHIVNVVFSNETLGFIEAEQRDDSHQPLSGVDIPDTDWAKVAEGMGAKGFTVRTKAEFADAIEAAKDTDLPVVIDVKFTHKMPFTTQHMFIDPAYQDQKDIDEFVDKYEAQSLRPLRAFLAEAKAATTPAPAPAKPVQATKPFKATKAQKKAKKSHK